MEDVTVLIMCYNQDSFVAEAIRSVRNQAGIEASPILFSDDHSSDGSVTVASLELASLSKAVVRVNELNLGVMDHYRYACDQVSTPLVAILEADDFWTKTSNLLDKIAFMNLDEKIECVFSGYSVRNDDGKVISFRDSILGQGLSGYLHFDELLAENLIGTFSNCMYRTDAFRQVLSEVEGLVGYDWLVNLLLARRHPIGFLSGNYATYRVTQSGTWSRMSEFRKSEMIRDTLQSVANTSKGRARQVVLDRLHRIADDKVY